MLDHFAPFLPFRTVDSAQNVESAVGTSADAEKSLWHQWNHGAFNPRGLCSSQGLITPGTTDSSGTTTSSDEHEQERTWCSELFPSTRTFDTFQGQTDPTFFYEVIPSPALVARLSTLIRGSEGYRSPVVTSGLLLHPAQELLPVPVLCAAGPW